MGPVSYYACQVAREVLEQAGLVVRDVLVLVDREQGGAADLAQRGYTLHALFRLTDVLAELGRAGRITAAQHDEVLNYLAQSR
mgnify:CR=1 FL=1